MQRPYKSTIAALVLVSVMCSGCSSFGGDSTTTKAQEVDAGSDKPLPKLDDRLKLKPTSDSAATDVAVQGDDCDVVAPKAVGKVFEATAKGVAMDVVEAKSLAPLWPRPVALCAFEIPKRKSVVLVAVGDTGTNAKAEVERFTDSLTKTKKPLFEVSALISNGLSDAWSLADRQGRNSSTAVVPVGSKVVQVVTIPKAATKAALVKSRSAAVAAKVVDGLKKDLVLT